MILKETPSVKLFDHFLGIVPAQWRKIVDFVISRTAVSNEYEYPNMFRRLWSLSSSLGLDSVDLFL